MRAIQFDAPKSMRVVDIESPEPPGPGQAVVKTHAMGICGTDVSCYLGRFPFFAFPRIPGHELGVEVVAVGDGVDDISIGDKCSVEPYMNCGNCYACRRGSFNCCENLKVVGVMMDGGLCDSFLIRADKLHPSSKLGLDQLALVETLAIGFHANVRAQPTNKDRVLIIGAGPIGLAALEFVRLTGAKVTMMDTNVARLNFANKNYAIDSTIQFVGDGSEIENANQITSNDRFHIVIDATGNAASMSAALNYVAHTGRLIYVGITSDPINFNHPQLHRPEMTIMASRNALPQDFRDIISLIEDGTVDTTPWITHRTNFENLPNDFESFLDPNNGVLKAMIELT